MATPSAIKLAAGAATSLSYKSTLPLFLLSLLILVSSFSFIPFLRPSVVTPSTPWHLSSLRRPSPPRPARLVASSGDKSGVGCVVYDPVQSDRALPPTYAASYPGSGSTLVFNLIESLTGVAGGREREIYQDIGNIHQAVAIKTHRPRGVNGMSLGRMHLFNVSSDSAAEEKDRETFRRAYVLLRHPIKALPSLQNFEYEYERREHLPGGMTHVVQSPIRTWIEWRDANFMRELDEWRSHLEYWMGRYRDHPDRRWIISYEAMVDDNLGPSELEGLASFLSRPLMAEGGASADVGTETETETKTKTRLDTEPVLNVNMDAVPCVWERVVKFVDGDGDESGNSYHTKRRGNKDRPYLRKQLDAMSAMLREVHQMFGAEDTRLASILDGYIKALLNFDSADDEGFGSSASAAVNLGPS